MLGIVVLAVLTLGSSALGDQTSLNKVVDTISAGVRESFKGHNTIQTNDFNHYFEFNFMGQKLPGRFLGSKGNLSGIEKFHRTGDAIISTEDSKKIVTATFEFDELIFNTHYTFLYLNFKAKGMFQFGMTGNTVTLKFSADQDGTSCIVNVQEVSFNTIGVFRGPPKLTGKLAQFAGPALEWNLAEFQKNDKSSVEEIIRRGFMNSVTKAEVSQFCSTQ